MSSPGLPIAGASWHLGRLAESLRNTGNSEKEVLSPLGKEGEARLRALAERRLEAVEGESDADELAGFAWWFSSGEFDTNWSLQFLRRALQAGCHPHPDHLIAEQFGRATWSQRG